MKLKHIFWSLLLLVLVFILPNLFYRTNGKAQGGIDLYALFLLLWVIVSFVSPVVLILRRTAVISGDIRFLYTLLSVFSAYCGILGIYKILTGRILSSAPLSIPFFTLNLLWAALLIIDIYRIRNRIRALAQYRRQ
jgi:hypothetical protein